MNNIAELAALLRETSIHQDAFDAAAAPKDWWDWYDWYAAYISARQSGHSPEEAITAAGRSPDPLPAVSGQSTPPSSSC